MDQPTSAKPKRKRRSKRSKSGARPRSVDRKQDQEIQALKKAVGKDQLKVDDTVSFTEQLDIVHGITEDKFQLAYCGFLNPLILKGRDVQSTPMSERASRYERFRWQKLTLGVIPLCHSGIAGSTLIIAIDYGVGDPQPRAGYSSVMMLPHREIPLGASLSWDVDAKILSQGRKGGWFVVDTDAKPFGSACPCRVSVYVFGQSRNIYGASAYDGPLWRVTVRATCQLSMYNFSPGLNALTSGTHTTLTFKKGEADRLVLETSDSVHLLELRAAKPKGFRNSLWILVGAFGEALKAALPGWAWLIEGGILILRATFESSGNGSPIFSVHPGVDDAAEGHGLGAEGLTKEVVVTGNFSIRQLSTVNPGPRESHSVSTTFRPSMPVPTGLTPWALSENSLAKDVEVFAVGIVAALQGQFDSPSCGVKVECALELKGLRVSNTSFLFCFSEAPPAVSGTHTLGVDDGLPAAGTWTPATGEVQARHWYSGHRSTVLVVEDDNVVPLHETDVTGGMHVVSFANQWFVLSDRAQKGWLPYSRKNVYVWLDFPSTVQDLVRQFMCLNR